MREPMTDHDPTTGTGDDAMPTDEVPWPQRMLDNLWLLLALSILIPGILYLGWGLWELAELPTWGGG
jgi:hypothetical protein